MTPKQSCRMSVVGHPPPGPRGGARVVRAANQHPLKLGVFDAPATCSEFGWGHGVPPQCHATPAVPVNIPIRSTLTSGYPMGYPPLPQDQTQVTCPATTVMTVTIATGKRRQFGALPRLRAAHSVSLILQQGWVPHGAPTCLR